MKRESDPTGVLLVNLGSPDSPEVRDVRRFLREFLSDPRVIDIHPMLRWLLLRLVILPFRPRTSAAAYRAIWTERGSPLLVHGRALRDGVQSELGEGWVVRLAMRYGSPSVEEALEGLVAAGVDRIVVLPLFPQYSSSSAGSALERVTEVAAGEKHAPPIRAVPPFYEHPAFVSAFAEIATPLLREFAADHVLMSYHGLPERQVRAGDPSGGHCLARPDCCDSVGTVNRDCYRAQCFATSRALAAALDLSESDYTVSFQSRLGRGEWIHPYTDVLLGELAERGVRRLAVACPAFVADCLETLEELGIRGRAQWREAGGEDFLLVPCPNAHPSWVRGVAELVGAES